MYLKLGNRAINTDAFNILNQIRDETGGNYLHDIKNTGSTYMVTCPFHGDHHEKHPSCGVFDENYGTFKCGDYHCFACGATGNIITLVATCFENNQEFAREWLRERFANTLIETRVDLPLFDSTKKEFIDESVLRAYDTYHPYMTDRRITEECRKKYKIGFNPLHNSLTFPVWDEHDNLVMITERSVNTKQFYIPKGIEKPVYLLNFLKNKNVKTLYVCESQINTLTLCGYGYDAVGLIGTGSKHQYQILNKCGIRHFCLALDGDKAGRKGIYRFINNINSNIMISVIPLPEGKDVNDISKEEFDNLPRFDKYDWLENYNKGE